MGARLTRTVLCVRREGSAIDGGGCANHAALFEPASRRAFRMSRGNWDVSPDGKRFLVESTSEASEGSRLEAVTDWFEELKRKL